MMGDERVIVHKNTQTENKTAPKYNLWPQLSDSWRCTQNEGDTLNVLNKTVHHLTFKGFMLLG